MESPENIVLSRFLIVKRSTLPNAGRGLFARISLTCGAKVGIYVADPVSDEQLSDPEYDSSYIIQDFEGKCWDGRRMDNKMRWINDPRRQSHKINCEFYMADIGKIGARTLRAVAAGEELFADYHWTEQMWRGVDSKQS